MALRTTSVALRGRLRFDEPLARYTVWGIGGPADRLYQPADLDDLCVFLAQCERDEPLFWLGLGSNVLIRDGGVRGTVVHLAGALDSLCLMPDGHIYVEAGVACPKVARFAARSRLTGAEFFAGIPGTVGGALAMNAGAFGGETFDIVHSVDTVDRMGRLHHHPRSAFTASYRHVEGPQQQYFVAARLSLRHDDVDAARERIRELLRRRAETQPTGKRSCGSVFRNPPGDHAARLIDTCSLKGRRIGGAVVSTKHANFIINDGQATAGDVESLIALIHDTVLDVHGVSLVAEVRIVGESR